MTDRQADSNELAAAPPRSGRSASPSFVKGPVRVIKAYEELAAIIRQRILSGELAEGDRIPSEATLAQEAQVSRSTVSEALRTLEQAGLVARVSRQIMVVRLADDEHACMELQEALQRRNITFEDLHEALLVLEPELTRLATIKAQTTGIAELEANLAAQADAVDDFPTWCRLDQEFHMLIADMSANSALVMARRPISGLLQPILETFVISTSVTRGALDFHRRIVEEIRVRDADAAALMTRKHVNELRAAWEHAGLDVELRIGDVSDDEIAAAAHSWAAQ